MPAAQPVVSLSAYSSGHLVGSKLLLPGLGRPYIGSGLVQTVCITSVSLQAAPFDLVLFNADPVNTTFTDRAAFSCALDMDKVIGVAHATDITAAGGSVAQGLNLALAFALPDGMIDAYAALVIRCAAAFTGQADVRVSLRVIQD